MGHGGKRKGAGRKVTYTDKKHEQHRINSANHYRRTRFNSTGNPDPSDEELDRRVIQKFIEKGWD